MTSPLIEAAEPENIRLMAERIEAQCRSGDYRGALAVAEGLSQAAKLNYLTLQPQGPVAGMVLTGLSAITGHIEAFERPIFEQTVARFLAAFEGHDRNGLNRTNRKTNTRNVLALLRLLLKGSPPGWADVQRLLRDKPRPHEVRALRLMAAAAGHLWLTLYLDARLLVLTLRA